MARIMEGWMDEWIDIFKITVFIVKCITKANKQRNWVVLSALPSNNTDK